MTALHGAAWKGHVKCITSLIRANASVDAKNNDVSVSDIYAMAVLELLMELWECVL